MSSFYFVIFVILHIDVFMLANFLFSPAYVSNFMFLLHGRKKRDICIIFFIICAFIWWNCIQILGHKWKTYACLMLKCCRCNIFLIISNVVLIQVYMHNVSYIYAQHRWNRRHVLDSIWSWMFIFSRQY